MAPPRKLLFVTNGYGEDSVGAEIIRRLPPQLSAEAWPTLGPGAAYAGVCPIVGPRAALPSEGSRIARGTLARDVLGGGLTTLLPGLNFLRSARASYDHVVVIGDFTMVAACWLAGVSGITYLDVYKTGYGRLYAAPERWVVARVCRRVFVRSAPLAESLRQSGVLAEAAGNVMMDTITGSGYDARARRGQPLAVTLLPGSRDQTVENFALQVETLRRLPQSDRPDIFLALAGAATPDDLAAAARLTVDGDRMTGDVTIHFARRAMRDMVEASDLVLSQAGTATIQALGLGVPAITFTRRGDRMKRYIEENRLFGGARLLARDEPDELAAVMARLLRDPAERARLAAIGRDRIGGPGAIARIIAALEAP